MTSQNFYWLCSRQDLKVALAKLKKTIDLKNSIPVFGQVEISPDLGGARLRVTDMEIQHSVHLPGSCTGPKVLIDFRQLTSVVDSLPDGAMVISTDPKDTTGQKLTGTLGKKTFSLFRWSDEGGLPELAHCSTGFPSKTYELDLAELTSPVMSTVSNDDSRYGLNGIWLEFYLDGGIGAVSTDGHRMNLHRAQVDEEEVSGVLLPRKLCVNLPTTAAGKVTLTHWQPLLCGGVLSGLATVDTSRLLKNSPRYRVHFSLGGDEKESRTVVREEGKIVVLSEIRPRQTTCTVQTSPEILTLLLTSQVSLREWVRRPEVALSGDYTHLEALYAEIGRGDMVQITSEDGTVLVSKCLEGDFPDYRQVVPRTSTRSAVLGLTPFDDALKYVFGYASEKTHCVRLSLHREDGEVMVYASNPDKGEASDRVTATLRGAVELTEGEIPALLAERRRLELPKDSDPDGGKPFQIGANGQYFRDAIKAFTSVSKGGELELLFTNQLGPIVIRRPGDESLQCLVMPMRIE